MIALERAAYHEAGHAVASVVLGLGLKKVSIVPDSDSGGRVTPKDAEAYPKHKAEQLVLHLREIIADYAGAIAEAKCMGQPVFAVPLDGSGMRGEETTGDRLLARVQINSVMTHFVGLIRCSSDRKWNRAEKEFERIMLWAGLGFVEVHWEEIKEVARYLMEMRELNQAEVEWLVRDASVASMGKATGAKGGKSRMAGLTPEQRAELGRRGAAARWGKAKPGQKPAPRPEDVE